MSRSDRRRRALNNEGREDIDVASWPPAPARPPPDQALEARLEKILSTLSLEDKVGQVIQADIGSVTPDDVREYRLGSILNGGNSAPGGDMSAPPAAWLNLADAFWDASMRAGARIPLIWGTDAVHGNSNVAGATIFPHAINLGAARDAELVERIGAATALEMVATGLDWSFAPTLAVVQDVRWGRTYEGFAADPELVAKLGAALVRGLQGAAGSPAFLGPAKVAATAKHFVGDGGTRDGRDQGDTRATEAELRDVHAHAYRAAMEAGVQSIMASFSSWGGRKLHGRADLLTGLLKQHWGFDGPVIGDWNAHGQLPGCTTERCPEALIAGLDLYMAPDSWRGLYHSTLEAVRQDQIPHARLDDAVRRMLRLKLRAGLFDKPRPSDRPFAGQFDLLSSPQHLELAREAARRSVVLLKNHNRLLPLKPNGRILVAGEGANDLGTQCGGWTLSWQGQGLKRADFPASETVLDGVARVVNAAGGSIEHAVNAAWTQRPDAAIVVIGEEPYAEFRGDLETLDYKRGDSREYDLIRRLRTANVPVVVVFLSGRPLWVNPALNAAAAFIAAFLPGTQAGALADLLFEDSKQRRRRDFEGRLPFAWPRDPDRFGAGAEPLFPIGFGLSLTQRVKLAKLHERGGATGADPHLLFDLGVAQGGWTLSIEDSAGAQRADGPSFQTPANALCARAVDLGQQENAVNLTWSGAGPARFVLRHAPLDLTRDANAACCLALHCVVKRPPERPLIVRLRANGAEAPLELQLAAHDGGGEPTLIEIPLKAFADGAFLAGVEAVELESAEAFEMTIARLSVAPMAAGKPAGASPSRMTALAQIGRIGDTSGVK
jgi:beta-glucosidase